MTDDDRPPIDTARIRACRDGEYTDLVHDLCNALDEARAKCAQIIADCQDQHDAAMCEMSVDHRAAITAVRLDLKNALLERDAAHREIAGLR